MGRPAKTATADKSLALPFLCGSWRGPGWPKKAAEIVRLLQEMVTRNTTWGYTSWRDALNRVGYDIGLTTIQRILVQNGIEPPRRESESIRGRS